MTTPSEVRGISLERDIVAHRAMGLLMGILKSDQFSTAYDATRARQLADEYERLSAALESAFAGTPL